MQPQGDIASAAGGYGPPGGAPPGGGWGPPGGAPPGGAPPGGGYGPPGGAPPGGAPPGGGYGPPGGAPPGGGWGPPGGAPPGGGYGPPGGAPPGGGYGPPGGYAAPKGKGKTGLIVGLVAGLIVLGGGGFAAWHFLGGGGGSSVAHAHLPGGCDAVLRFDVEGVMKVGPVKKHVVPALDEKAGGSDAAAKAKLTEFFVSARLNPKKDIDEAVVCLTNLSPEGEPDFVAIVGGSITPEKVVDALATYADKDEFNEPKVQDGIRFIQSKSTHPTIFVAQAEDGAILVASKFELLKKAAKKSGEHKKYKVPLERHASAIVTAVATKRLAGVAAGSPFAASLGGIGRVELSASLEPGKLDGRLELGDAAAATALAGQLKGMLGEVKGMPLVPAEAKATLDGLTISAAGKELVVSAPISAEAIEKAAEEFAKGVREAEKGL